MSGSWHSEFKDRMARFAGSRDEGSMAVSIKVRIVSGCFHREHSPEAYELIDEQIRRLNLPWDNCQIEEHESGPEILVIVAAATAGLSLAKSVIDLVTAIIKARSEGIKKGDRPSDSLELIVRGYSKDGEYFEEKVLRIPSDEKITPEIVEKALKTFSASGQQAKKLPKKK